MFGYSGLVWLRFLEGNWFTLKIWNDIIPSRNCSLKLQTFPFEAHWSSPQSCFSKFQEKLIVIKPPSLRFSLQPQLQLLMRFIVSAFNRIFTWAFSSIPLFIFVHCLPYSRLTAALALMLMKYQNIFLQIGFSENFENDNGLKGEKLGCHVSCPMEPQSTAWFQIPDAGAVIIFLSWVDCIQTGRWLIVGNGSGLLLRLFSYFEFWWS